MRWFPNPGVISGAKAHVDSLGAIRGLKPAPPSGFRHSYVDAVWFSNGQSCRSKEKDEYDDESKAHGACSCHLGSHTARPCAIADSRGLARNAERRWRATPIGSACYRSQRRKPLFNTRQLGSRRTRYSGHFRHAEGFQAESRRRCCPRELRRHCQQRCNGDRRRLDARPIART